MWIVFLLFLIFPNSIYDEQIGTQLIMWDVGQGQWVTINTYPYCLHFDAGGEYAPLKKIYKLCRQRKNIIFLSHGDWDHINKLSFFKKRNLDYCLFNYPLENLNLYKKNFLNSFIFCKETVIKNLKIFTPSNKQLKSKSSNHYSRVFNWKTVLLAGDSPQSQEKKWLQKIDLKSEIIALGHHGSNTSTSLYLLKKLKNLKLGLCSARRKKYGHPSPAVIKRLKQFHVPLVCTEDWGNIIIEL